MTISRPFLSLACLLLLLICAEAHAQETVYRGKLSGVECNQCKKAIAKSIAKIKGVEMIRIVKQGANAHQLEVTLKDAKPVSRSRVESALAGADHYKLLSWKKVK